MAIAMFLAAALILGGVVVVAMGRGGELERERTDTPTYADLDNWADVASYRPPAALLGYHAASTEHALQAIARTIADRDAEIAWLRSRLAKLQQQKPELEPAQRHQHFANGYTASGPVPEPSSAAQVSRESAASQDGTGEARPAAVSAASRTDPPPSPSAAHSASSSSQPGEDG